MILLYTFIVLTSQLQMQQVMTSQIRSHMIFSSDLLYSCAHLIIKIDEKFSINNGFYYDSMMILASGFFGHPVYYLMKL